MYLRAIHADATIPMLRQLIRDNPLGMLTTSIPSKVHPLIQCSHIPFLLDIKDESSETELGTLRGHLTRVNPQSKAMMDSIQAQANSTNILDQEVLVIFNSPVQHYVTPKFYTESKPSTGKVVPTWNYAAAQVYGRAKIFCDTKGSDTTDFLSKQIADLSQFAEESIMGFTGEADKPRAWGVSDAPERFIELLQKSIIGIEITIDRLEGKFKMSQELRQGDRDGVVRGFEAMTSEVGSQMADTVKQRGDLKQ